MGQRVRLASQNHSQIIKTDVVKHSLLLIQTKRWTNHLLFSPKQKKKKKKQRNQTETYARDHLRSEMKPHKPSSSSLSKKNRNINRLTPFHKQIKRTPLPSRTHKTGRKETSFYFCKRTFDFRWRLQPTQPRKKGIWCPIRGFGGAFAARRELVKWKVGGNANSPNKNGRRKRKGSQVRGMGNLRGFSDKFRSVAACLNGGCW